MPFPVERGSISRWLARRVDDLPGRYNAPDMLLQTILADPELSEQLDSHPVDSHTMTMTWGSAASQDATPQIEHPTIDLSADSKPFGSGGSSNNPAAAAAAVGVPVRTIVDLTDQPTGPVDYRRVGVLGGGGTGIVYQARQVGIDREVAVKVLRQDVTEHSVAATRFFNEARVMGGLEHPNIIALHELGVDQKGQPFYAMKRVEGSSWNEQIDDHTADENLQILRGVCEAVRYAHSRFWIHRDLKPENVMLGRFGEVLVADWGLATEVTGVSTNPLPTATTLIRPAIGGTPAYMAPELAAGRIEDVGIVTDVYLLGAILFRILTGRPPHHGDSLLQCIRNAADNLITATDVGGELMQIARHAMASDPASRYADAGELIAALDDHRTHAESRRLAERAVGRLAEVDDAADLLRQLRSAETLVEEALQIWPGNEEAASLRRTIRTRAEQAHRSRYSTLFTRSPEAGLLSRWGSSEIIEVNDAFLQLFGGRRTELLGRKLSELNLWVCPRRRTELIDQIEAAGEIENFEARLRNLPGDDPAAPTAEHDVLISGRRVDVDGVEMLLTSLRDVTGRLAAERHSNQMARRLRDLQSMAGLQTWSLDVPGGQIRWSADDADAPPPRNLDDWLSDIDEPFRQTLARAIGDASTHGTAIDVGYVDGGIPYRLRGQPAGAARPIAELFGVRICGKPTGATLAGAAG